MTRAALLLAVLIVGAAIGGFVTVAVADHTHERGATGPGGDHNIDQINAQQPDATPQEGDIRHGTGPGGKHNIDQIREGRA